MSTNRRKFLKIGTLAAFAAAMPVKTFGSGILKAGDNNSFIRNSELSLNGLGIYSKAAFASCINSVFRLSTGRRTVKVELVEVADMAPAGSIARRGGECFSLRFTGASLALPQNTYEIHHPVLGTFQLFLVPAGKDKDVHGFMAIVNRLAAGDDAKPFPKRAARLDENSKPRAARSSAESVS